MTAYQIADKAIAHYEAYVFASVGRAFDAFKADQLADSAAEACRVAARAEKLAGFRAFYAERAAEFAAIAA